MIRKPTRRPDDRIPSSSLADIGFLLLIFFLVTTVFPRDRGLALVLPEGEPQPVPPENVLHFQVRADGTVSVRAGASNDTRVVAIREIPDVWREAALRNERLIAAVQTSPEAPYGHMIDVLDGLRTADARRISLQLLEDPGGR